MTHSRNRESFFALPNEVRDRVAKLLLRSKVTFTQLREYPNRASVHAEATCEVQSSSKARRSPEYLVLPSGALPRPRRVVGRAFSGTLEEELVRAPFRSVIVTGLQDPSGELPIKIVKQHRSMKNSLVDAYLRFASFGLRLPGMSVYYEVRPLDHPDGLLFAPGAMREDRILLSGEIAALSDSRTSQELFSRFRDILFDGYSRLRAFAVSPGAMTVLREGQRLTTDVESSRSLDLLLENQVGSEARPSSG
jgi:hypothetical protein